MGLMFICVFYEKNGDIKCIKVIILDFVYGINFVFVVVVGFDVVMVKLNEKGFVDVVDLKKVVGEDMVVLMFINLNIFGFFEKDIVEMVEIVYEVGGKLYYDGVNLNVIMVKVRLGDMGFDVVYLNLYKIFIGFYGGGGFGFGLIGVKKELILFLLILVFMKKEEGYMFDYNYFDFIG